ncbi:uncharacterized protein LOC103789412 isoform X2 [Callithrix jacchus]|uniref:uncharacterized protein LOC103789412 isoform X2 n=1 Tax=Callithrix jacchus TaxID=9483 RepID=UPI0023DD5C47|nr:uncharacterized protein LOC103789412 isoform X2 [Callithrix jacchus]XP_035137790.2 uncharacterized protein LOC103789412 isoform X2 [Callithrix jacchus]XP_035137791.2 uncharacterized protein LOC103789412 isoform X2 [Callithrix jacchus]
MLLKESVKTIGCEKGNPRPRSCLSPGFTCCSYFASVFPGHHHSSARFPGLNSFSAKVLRSALTGMGPRGHMQILSSVTGVLGSCHSEEELKSTALPKKKKLGDESLSGYPEQRMLSAFIYLPFNLPSERLLWSCKSGLRDKTGLPRGHDEMTSWQAESSSCVDLPGSMLAPEFQASVIL